jgi:hypothetical protein
MPADRVGISPDGTTGVFVAVGTPGTGLAVAVGTPGTGVVVAVTVALSVGVGVAVEMPGLGLGVGEVVGEAGVVVGVEVPAGGVRGVSVTVGVGVAVSMGVEVGVAVCPGATPPALIALSCPPVEAPSSCRRLKWEGPPWIELAPWPAPHPSGSVPPLARWAPSSIRTAVEVEVQESV